MFKALYPKNASPIVIKFEIPKELISNINDFIGYKGKNFIVDPKYITEIINIDWDDLDYYTDWNNDADLRELAESLDNIDDYYDFSEDY